MSPPTPDAGRGPTARVHARARATARNRFVDVPTEEYLIQLWPDAPGS